MNSLRDCALIIAGHGSTLNPDSSAPTLTHAQTIRELVIFGEVAGCFWKEEPSYGEVFRMLDSREIYVVPNFISEGYFTKTVIPRELRLDGPVTHRNGRTICYCEPAGNHPQMTSLLLDQAARVAPGVPPGETSLLIVGHGTSLNDNSAVAAKRQVAAIQATGLYGEVAAAYMEEPPLIAEWDAFTTRPNVVVVPFFIADGLHSFEDIPVLLGMEKDPSPAAGKAGVFRNNPHPLRGRQLYYARAIGTDPGFSDIILDQVIDAPFFKSSHPTLLRHRWGPASIRRTSRACRSEIPVQ